MAEAVRMVERMSVERAASIARQAVHRHRVSLGTTEHGFALTSYLGSVVVGGLGTIRPSK